ncbi:MAG: transporter permease, partial [Deltaproteobacteria bacterium]|nr:transporter permease [Deltaproteobacteria bacterium]
MKTKKGSLLAIAVAVILILFPFFAPKFQLRMITEIIILTLFAMTWKMMLNEGGMFSFGHAVYFGLGAYASVLGWLHIPGLSFLSGIFLGALTSALV